MSHNNACNSCQTLPDTRYIPRALCSMRQNPAQPRWRHTLLHKKRSLCHFPEPLCSSSRKRRFLPSYIRCFPPEHLAVQQAFSQNNNQRLTSVLHSPDSKAPSSFSPPAHKAHHKGKKPLGYNKNEEAHCAPLSQQQLHSWNSEAPVPYWTVRRQARSHRTLRPRKPFLPPHRF